LGGVWFVDETNYRFIRLDVQSTSIEQVKKDDELLFFVSLKIDAASFDKNFSTY